MTTASTRKKASPARYIKTLAMAGAFALLGFGLTASYTAQGEEAHTLSPAGMRVEPLSIVKEDGTRETFSVEVAETMVQLQMGLMHRTEMPKDAGMLFYFGGGEGIVSFWMKNTLIPLDMIFIRGDGVIVNIHENAEPKSLASVSSRFPTLAVLEVNGGEARARGIEIGNRVEHHYFGAARGETPENKTQEPEDAEGAVKKDDTPQTKTEPAPLPSPELDIESPRLLERSRQQGLDADVQQR
ncbi:MAG TPA: DUF192 domain-containing protein [Alphaproteobacteria bacterium]|nr:DUF192 domain-containing protein [Alphaproteobacteria bacterium]